MKKILIRVLLIIFVVCVALISSCATQTESKPKPTLGAFYIPAITISEPEIVQDEYNFYKVPLTSVKRGTHMKDFGIVVKAKNISGFEAYRVIGVKIKKIRKGYAFIRLDDSEDVNVLKSGDQILDYIPEILQELNEMDHKWLTECFQRGKNME